MNRAAEPVPKGILVTDYVGNNVDGAASQFPLYRWIVVISFVMHRGMDILFMIFHFLRQSHSYLEDDRSSFQCLEKVENNLPGCGHRALLSCSEDPSYHRCTKVCGEIMKCCQKLCQSRCGNCQEVSSIPGIRDAHGSHPCGRTLHCQHPCKELCGQDHSQSCGYADCTAPCRQSCSHHICTLGCSVPCTPCAMPCPWNCRHYNCSVPCGSVSSLKFRLCNLIKCFI
jgi:hypothetical protein